MEPRGLEPLTLCWQSTLGITPGYEVRINEVLHEVDGPMLRHGIQEFHGKKLMVLPQRQTDRPDPSLVEARFQTFLDAS